jgi:hypothetical protein
VPQKDYFLPFDSTRHWQNHFESVAAEEYLKIIRQQGVAAWNEWRLKNRELLRPDLNDAVQRIMPPFPGVPS